MKQLIYIITIALVFSCKPDPQDHYIINAKASGINNGTTIYLQIKNELGKQVTKDSAKVLNQAFTFKGQQASPKLHYITIAGHKNSKPIILENALINLTVFKDSIQTSTITGTTLNTTYQAYQNKTHKLEQDIQHYSNQLRATPNNKTAYKKLIKRKKALQKQPVNFIANHNSSYISLILIDQLLNAKQTALSTIENMFKTLTTPLKQTTLAKNIAANLNKQKEAQIKSSSVQLGHMAPNFTANSPQGKTIALNTIKGKITIIDFWASWCRPCRVENPYVLKTYQAYHKKGLEIISISLDKPHQKEKWIQAIKDDNMAWHNVAKLDYGQDPIAQAYGVTSIPTTFIINRAGIVVAKNLRGRQLEYKIAELLD